MTSFGNREYYPFSWEERFSLLVDMGEWVKDQTKKGWLTSIFELGAWFGCLYSGFLAETLSRKYAVSFEFSKLQDNGI